MLSSVNTLTRYLSTHCLQQKKLPNGHRGRRRGVKEVCVCEGGCVGGTRMFLGVPNLFGPSSQLTQANPPHCKVLWELSQTGREGPARSCYIWVRLHVTLHCIQASADAFVQSNTLTVRILWKAQQIKNQKCLVLTLSVVRVKERSVYV